MMRVVALLLLASVAVVVAHEHPFSTEESSAFDHFLSFVKIHDKDYDNVEHFMSRFEVFRKNLNAVNDLNEVHLASGKTNTPFGITKFSDLSPEEFKAQYLQANMNQDRFDAAAPIPEIDLSAGDIDWSSKGAVTRVKDQGQCGSCWAFSATEAIESYAFLSGKYELLDLSAQQVTSCTYNYDGCEGGEPYDGYAAVEKQGGIDTDTAYPYTSGNSGTAGSCDYDASGDSGVSVNNAKSSSNDLQSQLANGPPSVCVAADTWQYYTGGVLSEAACTGQVDHCVQATGYSSSGDTPYWLVRNSWNTDWGEQGYIYLEMAGDTCQVQSQISYPTF